MLIANDYRRFNYTPYAYRTRDYGKTWERIVDQTDVQSYTLSIIEDPENPNLLFLGTDDGLYVSFDTAKKWQKWTEGFPTVSTKDLTIHPREHDLVIGTFGRAAWVLDDIRPLRAVAADPAILSKDIKVFDPPIAYQAAYQQPTGSRFGADAMYNAENRDEGAMITYFLKEGVKKAEPKKEGEDKKEEGEEENNEDGKEESLEAKKTKDSVVVQIYKGEDLIRTLKYKTPEKPGFHRIYWNMDEKGPDRPSRTIRKRSREAGGVDVKPGTYKVVLSLGEMMDETMITVASDPRLDVSTTAINEVYEASKKLEGFTQTAADAVKQLAESKKAADKYQKDLKELDKDKFKDAIKASKDISKKIDGLIDIYLGKVDKRQGITRNKELTVMRRIGSAYQYVRSRKTGITETETRLMQFAEADLKAALEKTNAFFADEWKTYRESIEPLSISMFKDISSFSLE